MFDKQELLEELATLPEEYQGVSRKVVEEIIQDMPGELLDLPQTSYEEIGSDLHKELLRFSSEQLNHFPELIIPTRENGYEVLPILHYLLDSLDKRTE